MTSRARAEYTLASVRVAFRRSCICTERECQKCCDGKQEMRPEVGQQKPFTYVKFS
jgi:hypothetical protein